MLAGCAQKCRTNPPVGRSAWAKSFLFSLLSLLVSCIALEVTWEHQVYQAWHAYTSGNVGEGLEFADRTIQHTKNSKDREAYALGCVVAQVPHQMQGELVPAEALFRESLSILASLPDANPEDLAYSQLHLTILYFNVGRCDEADVLARRAMAGAIKELGLEHRITAATMSVKGTYFLPQDN